MTIQLCGSRNGKWKGGKYKTYGGYIEVRVTKDDFFYPMCRKGNGRVLEHRLVMAKHLNRRLLDWEVVHHMNGIKDDNRLENLELIGCKGRHNTQVEKVLKRQSKEIKDLQARVTLLEAENSLLKTNTECSSPCEP
jgi:hypothetical protein